MTYRTPASGRTVRLVSILAFVAAFGAAYAVPGAQAPAKKALTVDDYTKWKNITAPELSADAKWLTYGLALTNTAPTQSKPVLHLLNLQTNQTVQVADATGGAFSADSAWLAYTVDPAASGRGGRGGRGAGGAPGGGQPPAQIPPRRLRQRQLRHLRSRRRSRPRCRPKAAARMRMCRRSRDAPNCGISRPAPSKRGRTSSRSRSRRTPRTCCCGGVRHRPAGGAAGRAAVKARRRRLAAAPARAAAARRRPAGPRGVDVTVHNLGDRPRSTARQRRRHLVQQGGRVPRLHRRRRRQGSATACSSSISAAAASIPLDNDAQVLQPPDVERRRHVARGAEGRGRREDARA